MIFQGIIIYSLYILPYSIYLRMAKVIPYLQAHTTHLLLATLFRVRNPTAMKLGKGYGMSTQAALQAYKEYLLWSVNA